jgi:hypothetical protein
MNKLKYFKLNKIIISSNKNNNNNNNNIINNFDWITYVNNYDDLINAGINNYNDALSHYKNHGISEGRTYTNIRSDKQNNKQNNRQNNIKSKTILFTNARDENNIIEWVAHHLNLGFDTIYINDHISVNPIKNLFKFNPRIIVNRLDNVNVYKKGLLLSAISYAKYNNYEWMMYLDADEFLIFPQYDNLYSFLDKYRDYDQIYINWLMFGSNFLDKQESNKTILESYTKCENTFNLHVKSFCRPNKITDKYIYPHCYSIENSNKIANTNNGLINMAEPFFMKTPDIKNISDINNSEVYIAHYHLQSYDTFLKRKVNRRRDDTGGKWTLIYDINTLHSISNDVHNLLPRDKYNDKNKQKITEIKN